MYIKTLASLMGAAGAHPKALQSIMGHESIKVTMDTYGHLFERAQLQAMDGLNAYLSRDTSDEAASRA